MLKYDKITVPLSEGTWIKTETSSGKIDYQFTPTDMEQVAKYSVKETGIKVVGKNASFQKVFSNNPISEFVAISLEDKKIADEILQFIRNYGFLFHGRGVHYFSAQEFCYLSKRMRLLLEVIEGLYLLDRRKAITIFSLLQHCVEIQSSCRGWFDFSWIDRESAFISPQEFEQEFSRSPRLHYYSFSNINFDVDGFNVHEKTAETKARLILAQDALADRNEEDETEHDSIEALTVDLLIFVFDDLPFYFNGGKLIIENQNMLDKPLQNAKELTEKLSILAKKIIETEINSVVPKISYTFSAENQAASPVSLDLFELMYFSLMILDQNKYIYTDCANPRCKKKVLKTITGSNGGYCCYACRKRHNAAEVRASKALQKGGAATL